MAKPFSPAPKPGGDALTAKRRAKARGKSAETRVAQKLGGRKVMFSGAGVLEKGDVRVETRPPLFVEVKYSGEMNARTGAHSYSLTYETIEKTVLDAQAAGCVPVIALVFGGQEHRLYLTTAALFEELVKQSQQLKALEDESPPLPTVRSTRRVQPPPSS